jgi:hypothetical protein
MPHRSKPQKEGILMLSKRRQRPSASKRKRPFKCYTPFFPEELEMIQRWGFANFIRNRGDAVRALVRKGLEAEERQPRANPL